jgi:hypothetical protein
MRLPDAKPQAKSGSCFSNDPSDRKRSWHGHRYCGKPAFRFADWKEGVVSRLPDPGEAFGLVIYRTGLTNAGLKELAGLKSCNRCLSDARM